MSFFNPIFQKMPYFISKRIGVSGRGFFRDLETRVDAFSKTEKAAAQAAADYDLAVQTRTAREAVDTIHTEWLNDIWRSVYRRLNASRDATHKAWATTLADKARAAAAANMTASQRTIKGEIEDVMYDWAREVKFDTGSLGITMQTVLAGLPRPPAGLASDANWAADVARQVNERLQRGESNTTIHSHIYSYLAREKGLTDPVEKSMIADKVVEVLDDVEDSIRQSRQVIRRLALRDLDAGVNANWNKMINLEDIHRYYGGQTKGFITERRATVIPKLSFRHFWTPRAGSETVKVEIKSGEKPVETALPRRGKQDAEAYWDAHKKKLGRFAQLQERSEQNPHVSNNYFKSGGSILTPKGMDRHEAALDFFEDPANKAYIDVLQQKGTSLKLIGKSSPSGKDRLRITAPTRLPLMSTRTRSIKLANDDEAYQRGLDYVFSLSPAARESVSPQLRLTQGAASKRGEKRATIIADGMQVHHKAEIDDLKTKAHMSIKAKKGHWYRSGPKGTHLRIRQDGAKTRYVGLNDRASRKGMTDLKDSMDYAVQYAERLANLHPDVSHRVMLDSRGRATQKGITAYDELAKAFDAEATRLNQLENANISVKAIGQGTIQISSASKFAQVFSNNKKDILVRRTSGQSWDKFVQDALDKAEKRL